MIVRLTVIFILILIVEIYTWQGIRTAFDSRMVQRIYLLISVGVVLWILYTILSFNQAKGITHSFMFTLGLFVLIYVPKLLVAVLLFAEDMYRMLLGFFNSFFTGETKAFLPDRRKFISQAALALASIPFASIIYGVVKGRYNYKVLKSTVYYDDLPDEFDGFTIMQLSDMHVGSFDNHDKIKYGVDLINEQKCDMLVFTGDIVNSLASEMDGWYDLFSKIQTPEFGKFSIMGNHDYGEYAQWPDEESKKVNLKAVKAIHPKIGFKLLLDENVRLKKGNSEMVLIGVENWGKNFQQYGSLEKASEGVKKEDFKILLSHDPTHWDVQVQDNPLNYHLTMSGHTHGMQFGIDIPGVFKWSPVRFLYPHWSGLYENAGRYLYVNRGFGYLAFPGRVGMWPEITLIELRKKRV